MDPTVPMNRVESALARTPPRDALREVAEELRDGGMPRSVLLALFDAARGCHSEDADEASHDAILEVMDFISGWCHPSQGLYPDPEHRA
ncbi:hypothetical protein TA3x_005488 [Tundrisphaera sp. TA3]|uniref:hypothetical protein n=1 Tax=Tundrisphaera sp. TA3 TaxID=3435775 RepID=UPI003EBFB778